MAVTTALLPIIFGMFDNVGSSMDLGYFNSIASILVAVLSPILGTIADYKDRKKRFLFSLRSVSLPPPPWPSCPRPAGNGSCSSPFTFCQRSASPESSIFYDSFLVDVTEDERMDKVSTRGFAYGYIFSCIPFGISLLLIFLLGMDKAIGYQIGFIITALWWGLLTVPMIRDVKQRYYIEPEPKPVARSFQRIAATFRNIRQHRIVFVFLLAYFFYIDGVDTIIKMVVPYATSVLGTDALDTFTLLGILLIIQIIAFPCAILYGNLAKTYSARNLIIAGIFTYVISCIAAFFISSVWHIFLLGALIGSAQGGIQALSRSYFAKIIPKENSNEFFGFYNIFGKFAAILGPALMSLTTTLIGDARYSILSIIPLFLIGFFIFITLPKGT